MDEFTLFHRRSIARELRFPGIFFARSIIVDR